GRSIASEEDWWGVLRAEALAEIEGSFALAWREEDGAVSVARDPIGHRSVYYALSAGTFAFASRVRALVDAGAARPRLDLRSIAAFLAYAYVRGEAGMVDGIREVLPGERITFRNGVIARMTFWVFPREPAQYAGEDALRRALRESLEGAVAALLPAD